MDRCGIENLNEQQKTLVYKTEGAILVAAGAGSGKTRLLTHRIAHLVCDLKIAPYNILAITFTNKAADEMRARLGAMIERANELWVMTFHALCVRILRRDIDKLGYLKNFSIYSESDVERVIKRIIGSKSKDKEDADFAKSVRNHISYAKCHNLSEQQMDENLVLVRGGEKIGEIYKKYRAELKKSNALDFDDLLIKAHELLTKNKDVLEHYQQKFKYIHIDEFQDTSTIQYDIVRLLAGENKNIFAVGDEDQSIYGWRGASSNNMRLFIDQMGAEVFKLEQNYRSTKNILDAANRVISNNTNRIDKVLWTENSRGVRIEVRTLGSEGAEADFVVDTINTLVRYSGYSYNDFAILMRLNALSRSFEERLMYYNIPYKVFGGFKFYERKEIKDILAYLKLLANPFDCESLVRIINFPKRGIGDAAINQLLSYCDIENKPLMQTIIDIKDNQDLPLSLIKKLLHFSEIMNDLYAAASTMNIFELVDYIVARLSLKDVLYSEGDEGENRVLNVDDFIAGVEEFVRHNPDATLDEYLQAISLYADTDELDQQKNNINVATIHSAKGLEFKVVFLVGLEEGIFPLSRSIEERDGLEEERRLMYVALTRAKERLYLTRASTRFLYGGRKVSLESRFIAEAAGMKKVEIKREVERENQSSSVGYNAAKSAKQFLESVKAPQPKTALELKIGDRVSHTRFGEGIVVKINGSGLLASAEIEFDKAGAISLSIGYAPLIKL